MPLTVRPEEPRDHAAVYEVNRRAFGRPEEADLVESLRGLATMSLVAEDEGIVGHILFTPVTVRARGGAVQAVALGPMAVAPKRQRQGVGSVLVRAGLEACRLMGETVVFVLGHPDYYPRFGFRSLAGTGLRCKYVDADSPAFLAAELEPGTLQGMAGMVEFRPEFDEA